MPQVRMSFNKYFVVKLSTEHILLWFFCHLNSRIVVKPPIRRWRFAGMGGGKLKSGGRFFLAGLVFLAAVGFFTALRAGVRLFRPG